MAVLTDTEFEDRFFIQPVGYFHDHTEYGLDLWAGVFDNPPQFTQPISEQSECWDDIEKIYTELDRSVDGLMSNRALYTPLRLEQVRERNHKLIAKLESLNDAITRGTTPISESAEVSSCPNAHSTCVNLSIPEVHETGQAISDRDLTVPGSTQSPQRRMFHDSPLSSPRSPSLACVKGGKLVKKLLMVGDREARLQVAEFATQLQLPDHSIELPRISHFSSAGELTVGPDFLQLIAKLGLTIESSMFGEQNLRLRKRLALAHFYHAYTAAQEHPDEFLSWCDNQRVQGGSIPKGGIKSVVQHRFADLIFSRELGGASTPPPDLLYSGDVAKRRSAKIQTWRKSGKKWAQLIRRFGHGILLLLPPCLSDEDLRTGSDEVISHGLDLIDSRKYLFEDVLQQANDLLEAYIFLPDQVA